MLNYVWLQRKRLAVLGPGLMATYLSTTEVFPYVHRHLPFAPAILITYMLGAYVLVPGMMRFARVFFRPRELPLYCITPDGFASDPINIGIIGTRRQLIMAMESAGWHVALPGTPRTLVLTIAALVLNKPFPGMPMTRLYLFGHKQDVGFEKQIVKKGRGHRHHVRFWAINIDSLEDIKEQIGSGQRRDHHNMRGQLLWVGAASRDAGLALIRQSLQVAHFVDPDTNQERDYMARRLVRAGLATQIATIELHAGLNLINRALFAHLFADGKMTILQLKPSTMRSPTLAISALRPQQAS